MNVTLEISYTSKSPNSHNVWTLWNRQRKHFADRADAEAWLAFEYIHCKTVKPIYTDTESRGTVRCGRIYCFKVKENGKTHYEQHWITFYCRHGMVIDITKEGK